RLVEIGCVILIDDSRRGLIDYGRRGLSRLSGNTLAEIRFLIRSASVSRKVVPRQQHALEHRVSGINPGVDNRHCAGATYAERALCLGKADDLGGRLPNISLT